MHVDEGGGFWPRNYLAKQRLAPDRLQLPFLLKFEPKIVEELDGVNPGFKLAILPSEHRCFPPGGIEKTERLRRIAQDRTTLRQIGRQLLLLRSNGIWAEEDSRDQKQVAKLFPAPRNAERFDDKNKLLRGFHYGALRQGIRARFCPMRGRVYIKSEQREAILWR